MCGIVGYVGPKQAEGVVVEGLRRLEYRGYDSAGVALVVDGRIAHEKRAGKIANLLVTEGDLFDEKMQIKHVFVGGRRVNLEAAAPEGSKSQR